MQTVLGGADVYYWFGSGYGDVTRLASPFASTFDIPIIESMVSVMVQCFYAYRVWVLSNKKSWWFCLLICLVGLSQGFLNTLSQRLLPYSVPLSTQWQDSPEVFMFVFFPSTLLVFCLTVADSRKKKVCHWRPKSSKHCHSMNMMLLSLPPNVYCIANGACI